MLPPRWLRFLVTVLLILGVCFRFANLDRKVYWCDETYTSLRISGYTAGDFVQQVFNGKIIDVRSLQKYQQPNFEKSAIVTIQGLAAEEPQHSPLYYVFARFWMQAFGNSVAVPRSLAALISLLSFPGIYWLCLELFESSLIGWISVALISLSSFHVLYAQEAREYSLWIVTILFASASLLQAMRKQVTWSWGLYAVALALSFYSFLFSLWMAIGHGIYVALSEGFRLSKTVVAYLSASLVGFILFLPWFLVVFNSHQIYTSTVSSQTPFSSWELLQIWGRNLSVLFFDDKTFGFQFFLDSKPQTSNFSLILVTLTIVALVGYSIYFICKHTPERIWLFILTLIGSTALPLVLIDLYMGWRLTGFVRYLIPSCLGIQLTVAYLLATKIFSISISFQQKKLWSLVAIALISGGVLSGAISSQAETAWNKGNFYNPSIATIVNKANRPLLISYSSAICDVLSLSHLLSPKVKLLLFPILPGSQLLIPKIDERFSDIFFFDPHNSNFRYELESQHKDKRQLIYEVDNIKVWKI